MTLNPQIKLVLDVLPLVVFFVGFKWLGLFDATALLLCVTLGIVAITVVFFIGVLLVISHLHVA